MAEFPRADAAYRQVMADMRLRIASGEWAEGVRIPTIDELVELYPQSRMTIVRAARELKLSGELIARGKAGTIVASRRHPLAIGILYRLNFADPSHAEFTFRVAQLVRKRLEVMHVEAPLFEEDAYPYASGSPSRKLEAAASDGSICGLVAVQSYLPQWLDEAGKCWRLPFVGVGVYPAKHRVFVDYCAALEAGVDVLLKAGCKRIGLVSNLPPLRDRLCERSRRMKFAVADEWMRVDHQGCSESFGYEAMRSIWSSPKRPDAIFVSDDVLAKGVAQAAVALHIQVPDELSLACMANLGIERFYPCPVQRVDIDLAHIAKAAADMALRVAGGAAKRRENVDIPPLCCATGRSARCRQPLDQGKHVEA